MTGPEQAGKNIADEPVREFWDGVLYGPREVREVRARRAERLLPASRVEEYRVGIPETIKETVQVVVDNPSQFALIGASTVVAGRIMTNLMRPRNPLEALAMMAVLHVGLVSLAAIATERGWLKFRIRDEDGKLVPLIPGKAETDAAPAAEK